LSGDHSLNYMLTRLILVSVIYYLEGEDARTSLMVFRDIVSCIVSKVNYYS
jgi:hypothetical protein